MLGGGVARRRLCLRLVGEAARVAVSAGDRVQGTAIPARRGVWRPESGGSERRCSRYARRTRNSRRDAPGNRVVGRATSSAAMEKVGRSSAYYPRISIHVPATAAACTSLTRFAYFYVGA